MTYFKYILIIFFLTSCTSDDSNTSGENNTDLLSNYIANRTFEVGAIIACAANTDANTDSIEVYFFPEGDASNFRLYETNSSEVDSNTFSNYKRLTISDDEFFNGYLRKFVRPLAIEQWLIVTYELDGDVKISNPIRIKNLTQPTLFSNQININQQQFGMPHFSWNVNSEVNNAIFFQVLSTIDYDLISGTYTFENYFQYYDTSNVVLNITDGVPPNLTIGQDYKFTIMDVSEDNWVNEVFMSQFTIE